MKFSHIFIILLLAVSACASPIWSAEIAFDDVKLWLTTRSEKAVYASELAVERMEEIKDRTENEAFKGIYSVQDLFTTIEENINIAGNPHKVLRKQQTIEDNLRSVHEMLKEINAETEEYGLVVEHASMRAELLLEEVEFAKQKTKNKIE